MDIAQSPSDPGVPRALVLSGGGSKGAFEAGAMYHLINHRGCDFVDIAGVSVGGFNASFVGQAPRRPDSDSLANLQKKTDDLVTLWRNVKNSKDFLHKRFWGKQRMALFGIESLNDLTPAREWIANNIDPSLIQKSGRNVRVGTVNFYDGSYHEITPGTGPGQESPELLGDLNRYRDFVFGGGVIPVLGKMPQIQDDNTDPNCEHWPQYGDGGLRHQTPVAGYFDPHDIRPLKEEEAGQVPPHEPVAELIIVMSSPFAPLNDTIPPPRSCPQGPHMPKHVKNGKEIFMRVMDIVLDSPYRWDANFAILANGMLEWRRALYDLARDALKPADLALFHDAAFPVKSYHRDGGPPRGRYPFSLPYKLGIVAPRENLTETYDFRHAEILKQLNLGCLAANDMMQRPPFNCPSMEDKCKEEFPNPER